MLKRTLVVIAVVLYCHVTDGQGRKLEVGEQASPTVAVAATPSGMRFVALGAVKRLQLEVLDAEGASRFDSEFQPGSVYDWSGRDAQGIPLGDGSYPFVLTVVAADGRISLKQGAVVIVGGVAALDLGATEPAGTTEPMEGVEREGEAITQAMTVTAHDGKVGQVVSTTDALSFRLGDFFSGKDREAMRLTEKGLSVFGTIRAAGGIVFDDGTALTSSGTSGRVNADGTITANIAGTGSQNALAKWIDNAGTLGNSAVTEVSGNVGIGVPVAAQRLHVFGKALFQNTGTASVFIVDRTDGKIAAMGAGGVSATLAYDNTGIFKIESNSRPNIAAGVFGTIQGATTRLVLDGAGNLGVGLETPQHRLDVAGNVNTSGEYRILGERVLGVSIPASNTFVGYRAGEVTPPGWTFNSFFGHDAGKYNNGSANSFFGAAAGMANVGGLSNAFFGARSGIANTDGKLNVFSGYNSGGLNTVGEGNTFIGAYAGFVNETGDDNTSLGSFATFGSERLLNATAIGSRAMATASDALVLGSIDGVNGSTRNTRVGIGTTSPAARLHVDNGSILTTTNRGSASALAIGQRWRDNSVVAWARINAAGTIDADVGVVSVGRPDDIPVGVYVVTISASAESSAELIPIAVAEIDLNARPTNEATMRNVGVNQVAANVFYVYVNTGSGTPVDNDFVFMVTAR